MAPPEEVSRQLTQVLGDAHWRDGLAGLPEPLTRQIGRIHAVWRKGRADAFDLETESLALDMGVAVPSQRIERSQWPGVLARLIRLHGLPDAIRVLAGAGVHLFHRDQERRRWSYTRRSRAAGAKAAAFVALRAVLCTVDQAEFEAARELARELGSAGDPRLHAKLAHAFTDAEQASALCRAELDRLGPNEPLEADLINLLSVIDVPELSLRLVQEVCERVATLGTFSFHDVSRGPYEPYVAYRLAGAAKHVYDMAEVLGEPSLPALGLLLEAAMRDREIGTTGRRRIAKAIAIFETDDAAARLASVFGRKGIEKVTTTYFREHPALAREHLGQRAKGRSQASRLAKALLEEAERRLSVPEITASQVSVPVSAGASEAPPQQVILPPVLDRPPWRYRRRVTDTDETLYTSLPAKPPRLHKWVQLAALPRPLTRGGVALPDRAVKHLVEMLMFTPLAAPYAGLRSVIEACDEASLARFALALFRLWQTSHPKLEQPWPVHALALLGDVSAIEPLLEEIDRRAWASENPWVELALTGLAHLRTPYARYRFLGLARRSPQRWVAERSRELAHACAEQRGITLDALTWSSLPHLGFGASGTQRFDLGDRELTLALGSDAEALLFDGDRRLKRWPSARMSEASETFDRSRAHYRRLQKELAAVRAQFIGELEAALSRGAHWQVSELHDLLLHPVASGILRRLLFMSFDERGAPLEAFRVGDDGHFADARDEPLRLADSCRVGLSHPLDLSPEALASWTEIWADYELLPPFAQLQRPVFERIGAELDADLDQGPEERLQAWTWDARRLGELFERGFTVPSGTTRTGQVRSLTKRLGVLTVELVFDPPLREREDWGSDLAELTLFESRIVRRPALWSALSAREFSELILDLTLIRGD